MPCGCINSDCSHRSSTVTSSSSTTTTTLCPDAIGNDSVYTDECVIYTGPTIDCFGIKNGANIFIALYQLLFLFDSSCTTTTTSTTSTTTSTTTTSTTTSSTTTTSTTTSSSTTTTTAPPCLTCVTFTNNTGTIVDAEYKNCQGLTTAIALRPRTTVSYCGCCATAYGVAGVIIDQSSIPCVNGVCQPPTTTTTSTTVGPFETYCMGFTNSSTTLGVSMDYYDAFGVLHQPVLIVPPSSTVYVCASRTGGIPAEITVNVLPGSCLTRPECNPALPTTTTTSSTTSSTTTTTTAFPTTTTTTTLATACYGFANSNAILGVSMDYYNANGIFQQVIVPALGTVYVCASSLGGVPAEITVTNTGSCAYGSLCDPFITTTTTSTTTTTTTTTFAPTPYRCMNVNSGFNTDLSGWEVTKGVPPGAATSDWVWDAGRAAFQGGDTGGYISQSMMQLGYTYRITFDLEIVNSGFLFNKSIRIYAGTAASPIINTIGLTSVDVTLMCTDTTYFSIYGVETMNVDGPSNIFIDNVCVEQTIPARPTTTTTTSTTTSTTTTTTLAPTTTTTTSTTSTTTSTTTTSTTTTSTTLAPTTTTSTTTTTTTIAPTTSTTTTTSTTSTTTTTTLVPTTTTTTSTTSTTTSTTTTSTTTTTTTQFNFTKCADCVPTLAGITQDVQGLLNVGLLSSGPCTLGDYVIDWYLNSTSAPLQTFSSKNSGNTDITASQIHPFSVPSQSGTWIPVIKYITLDGIAYSPNGGAYSLSADLATCLPTVSITSLTCTAPTVGQPFYSSQASYSHYFRYVSTNTSVLGDANKTMTMELNSDGSTKYLPWYFYGYTVSDRIKFSYVSPLLGTTTLLEDYVIGPNVLVINMTSTPRTFTGSGLKGVLNLNSFTYNTGDRILIEVIGNYMDPTNAGTDWFIYLKCLNTFSTAWTKIAPPIACSSVLATVACTNKATISFPSYTNNSTTDIAKYLLYTNNGWGSGTPVNPGPTSLVPSVNIGLSTASYNCTTYGGLPSNTPVRTPSLHPYTVTKTGANVVLNFTNDVEYNIYRNSYLTAYNYNALTYSSDITLATHFKFISITIWLGTFEVPISYALMFHQTSNVVFFNDGTTRTMTIDMVNAGASSIATPPVCVSQCNSIPDYTSTSNSINYIAANTTSGTSSYTTTLVNNIWDYPIRSRYLAGPAPVAATTSSANNSIYSDMYLGYMGSPTCVFTTTPTDWYAYTGASVGRYLDFQFVLKVTISDVNNPSTNFKIENQLNYTTHMAISNVVIDTIYEIVGGVVTTPIAGCP